MFSKIYSSATIGIDAYIVEVETHSEKQIPNFLIVGLPDSAIKESRERVTAAIKNSGFQFPLKKITVNLAPADIKKEGSAFDLPIAIGILNSAEMLNTDFLETTVMLGELSLDGTLRKIKGALSITVEAKEKGFKQIILPKESAKEASIVEGIDVYGLENLSEVIEFLNGKDKLTIKLFWRLFKSVSSVIVPGVIIRTTSRSNGPLCPRFFASSGLSICSHTAIFKPEAINFIK